MSKRSAIKIIKMIIMIIIRIMMATIHSSSSESFPPSESKIILGVGIADSL